MNRTNRELLDHYGFTPNELPDHTIHFRHAKRTLNFTATCSCGVRINRATGLNHPGVVYALKVSQERFNKHIAELQAEDTNR